MSSFEHILLYLLLFLSLYVFQRKQQHVVKLFDYVLYALVPILLFSFIEGCRYGRGADFFWYKYRFEYMHRFVEPQWLFGAYEHFLGLFSHDYVFYFVCNSVLFIVAIFIFLKRMFTPKECRWMYIISVCALLFPFETFVRQYLAFPFLLFFIMYLMNAKEKVDYVKCVVMLILMNMLHSGLLFGVPFILVFYYCIRKTLSYKIVLLCFFVAYFVIPNGFFADAFSKLVGNAALFSDVMASDATLGYLENSERWFSSQSILDNTEQSFSAKLMQFFFESSIAVGGGIALKVVPNQKILTFYNMFILGTFFTRVFWGYEIFSRLFNQLYVFWFIPCGYVFYAHRKSSGATKQTLQYCVFIICAYLMMYWGRYIFLSPKTFFVWNI